MAIITVTLNTANSVFDVAPHVEVSALLYQVARRFDAAHSLDITDLNLYDSRKQWCGFVAIDEDAPAPPPVPAPALLGRTTEDLFMCEYLGEATDPDTGNKYELCSVLGSHALSVRSLQGKKRKSFLFDLPKLVDYAVEHGKIDHD